MDCGAGGNAELSLFMNDPSLLLLDDVFVG